MKSEWFISTPQTQYHTDMHRSPVFGKSHVMAIVCLHPGICHGIVLTSTSVHITIQANPVTSFTKEIS